MTEFSARNYRQSYIKLLESCGCYLPADLENYDVHHLDCDRKNNSVSNLVLINKQIHELYHYLQSRITHYSDSELPTESKAKSDLHACMERYNALYEIFLSAGFGSQLYMEMVGKIAQNEIDRRNAEDVLNYILEYKPKWESIQQSVLQAKEEQAKFHK